MEAQGGWQWDPGVEGGRHFQMESHEGSKRGLLTSLRPRRMPLSCRRVSKMIAELAIAVPFQYSKISRSYQLAPRSGCRWFPNNQNAGAPHPLKEPPGRFSVGWHGLRGTWSCIALGPGAHNSRHPMPCRRGRMAWLPPTESSGDWAMEGLSVITRGTFISISCG